MYLCIPENKPKEITVERSMNVSQNCTVDYSDQKISISSTFNIQDCSPSCDSNSVGKFNPSYLRLEEGTDGTSHYT